MCSIMSSVQSSMLCRMSLGSLHGEKTHWSHVSSSCRILDYFFHCLLSESTVNNCYSKHSRL